MALLCPRLRGCRTRRVWKGRRSFLPPACATIATAPRRSARWLTATCSAFLPGTKTRTQRVLGNKCKAAPLNRAAFFPDCKRMAKVCFQEAIRECEPRGGDTFSWNHSLGANAVENHGILRGMDWFIRWHEAHTLAF